MNAILRPAIPFVDVQIGAADGCDFHPNQHVGASEAWDLHFPNLRPRSGFRLNDGQHSVGHV